MSLLLNLASISNLRRMAMGALIILETCPKKDTNLYKESIEQVEELIGILLKLVEAIKEYDHILLLEEPWDKIIIKVAKNEYINIDNRKQVERYIMKIIEYLTKILNDEPLDKHEREKLRRFLMLLVDIPISEEYKLLKTLRGW